MEPLLGRADGQSLMAGGISECEGKEEFCFMGTRVSVGPLSLVKLTFFCFLSCYTNAQPAFFLRPTERPLPSGSELYLV